MKKKLPAIIFLSIIAAAVSVMLSPPIYVMISQHEKKLKYLPPGACLQILRTKKDSITIFFGMLLIFAILIYFMAMGKSNDNKAELYNVTPEIAIPKPSGQKQHGSAWFISNKKFCKDYPPIKLNLKNPLFEYLLAEGKKDFDEVEQIKSEVKVQNKLANFILMILKQKYEVTNYYLKKEAKKQTSYENLVGNVSKLDTEPFKGKGGLVVGYKKKGNCEILNVLKGAIHSIILGTTRSGKTRCLVLQSILVQLLAGDSVFVSDIKGELYQYLYPILKRLGINVIVLDFRDMNKSMSYNYLQPIIDKLHEKDVNKASQMCRDYAEMIAGKKNENTEAIWHDGEVSTIAAAIMACCYDNQEEHPERQNLPYVCEWLTRMTADRGNRKGMLLNEYLETVGESHPANLLLAQAKVAPQQTRGSFYTSACTALGVFTDRELYHICNHSDFKLTDIATKRTAFFVILPQSKTTFYPLVSLLVSQLYEALDRYATSEIGTGRLPRKIHFDLDEFGNFSAFKDFNTMLTAAGSMGMIMNLFVQSYAQLEDKYGKIVAEIIKGNCVNKIYLKSTDEATNKSVAESLCPYTTVSYSKSSNSGKYSSGGSDSMQLSQRQYLLYPNELTKLKRPYMLVMGDSGSIVTYSPDLSEWAFNTMLGLGNEEHNDAIRAFRQNQRPIISDVSKPVNYVGGWTPKEFANFSMQCYQKAGRL